MPVCSKIEFVKIQDGRRRNDEFYQKSNNFKTVCPICPKFGTDRNGWSGTDELVGGENRKSASGFMRMRNKTPC
jgi:hypothetical protein